MQKKFKLLLCEKTFKRMKRQMTAREKLCLNYILGNDWYPQYIKNSQGSRVRKQNPLSKWAKDWRRRRTKEHR